MKTFLSSTYIDLKDYRQAASEALERLGLKVNRMEVFGARPDEPKEACLKEIEDCDLFVGIYAYRYGHISSGSPISITEQEFNHAIQKGRPAFCFFIDEDHPWPPKFVDSDPGRNKLKDLKNRIKNKVVVDFFTTAEDLKQKVTSAIARYQFNINLDGKKRMMQGLQVQSRKAAPPSSLADLERLSQGFVK